MKHILSLLAAFVLMAVSGLEALTIKGSEEPMTIKPRMLEIHDRYGVNFVYDSSLDLDVPCKGPSDRHPDSSGRHPLPDRESENAY